MKKDLSHQEKLIKFMKGKGIEVCDDYGFKRTKYFNNKDEQAISNWYDKKAEDTWFKLFDNIFVENAKGIDSNTCVFCICHTKTRGINKGNLDCGACSYGKNHGICKKAKSDYRDIEAVFDLRNEEITNEFYKKLHRKYHFPVKE